jgi:hypothetical protein
VILLGLLIRQNIGDRKVYEIVSVKDTTGVIRPINHIQLLDRRTKRINCRFSYINKVL